MSKRPTILVFAVMATVAMAGLLTGCSEDNATPLSAAAGGRLVPTTRYGPVSPSCICAGACCGT